MEHPPPIAEERERVVRLARRVLAGELSARDGATESSKFVDPAGGPASLDAEHRDLYMEFYGWLSEEWSSETWRPNEEIPELVASYEASILAAAKAVVLAYSDLDL